MDRRSPARRQRNSWLFVPLLHASAGFLTQPARRAWRAAGAAGSRFDELAAALGGAPPQQPAVLLRTLRTLVACDAGEELSTSHPLESELDRELDPGTTSSPMADDVLAASTGSPLSTATCPGSTPARRKCWSERFLGEGWRHQGRGSRRV